MGGDKLVLLSHHQDMYKAIEMAESIQSDLANTVIEEIGHLKASIGIASYEHGDSEDSIVKKVDDLMYKSKSNGNSGIQYIQ